MQISMACSGATLTSNSALSYVTYPTQLLAKSCKLLPVMLMGFLVGGRRYRVMEYVSVFLITAGVVIYSVSKELKGKLDIGGAAGTSVFGLCLLALSLLCDGFTGPRQDVLKKKHHLTEFELMFSVNFYSAVLVTPCTTPTVCVYIYICLPHC